MDVYSTYEDVEELENRKKSIDDCRDKLERAHQMLLFYYESFFRHREFWAQYRFLDREIFFLKGLNGIQEIFDVFSNMNTPAYAWYVHYYNQTPLRRSLYVDYKVELQKIKHQILESEVNWYVENIEKELVIATKQHGLCYCCKSVLDLFPIEARHIRMIISHALEQLEAIAEKISTENAKDYAKDIERYTWCLTGMLPLLSEEEQDPFKQGGIHQRWQKARNKIQEAGC